jgi:hypothetical protein
MSLFTEAEDRAEIQEDHEPTPLPFREGVAAVFDAGRLTDQSISTHYQTADILDRAFAGLRDNGLPAPQGGLGWPVTDSVADAAFAYLDSQRDAILARRSPDFGPVDARLVTGEEARQMVRDRVSEARALAERAGAGAQLVGGLAVGAADPLNLALLPLGAGAGGTLLRRALIEAGIGAASQVAVEAASLEAKERGGVPQTLGGAAANVALTGLVAGALPPIFHGAAALARRAGLVADYRAAVAAGKIEATPEMDAAAAAIDDLNDTVPPGATPAAEAAHLDATAAGIDVLRAESPEEAAAALARLESKALAVGGEVKQLPAPGDLGPPDVDLSPSVLAANRSTADAAIAAEQAAPMAPVVEPSIDAPARRPSFTPEEDAEIEGLRTLLAERPDLEGAVEFDGIEVTGNVSDLLARIDAEIDELTQAADCLTGVVV